MNIQLYQLIFLLGYAVLIIAILKIKYKSIKIILATLGLIIFFVNPVRFEQKGGEQLEISISRFNNIPEKVELKKESFKESQARELEALKQQSEDRKNEIHN